MFVENYHTTTTHHYKHILTFKNIIMLCWVRKKYYGDDLDHYIKFIDKYIKNRQW